MHNVSSCSTKVFHTTTQYMEWGKWNWNMDSNEGNVNEWIHLSQVIAFRWKEESGLFWKSWTQVDFNRKKGDLFHEWALERQLRSQSGDGGSLARSKWWIPGTMLRWVWKRSDQSWIQLFFRRSDILLIAEWGCPLKMEEEQMQFHPICAGSSIRIEVPQ